MEKKKGVIGALIWPQFLGFLYFASPEFLTSLKSRISVLTWIYFILCGSGINARGGGEVAYCIPKGMSPPYWSILHPAQLGNIYNMPKSPAEGPCLPWDTQNHVHSSLCADGHHSYSYVALGPSVSIVELEKSLLGDHQLSGISNTF